MREMQLTIYRSPYSKFSERGSGGNLSPKERFPPLKKSLAKEKKISLGKALYCYFLSFQRVIVRVGRVFLRSIMRWLEEPLKRREIS